MKYNIRSIEFSFFLNLQGIIYYILIEMKRKIFKIVKNRNFMINYI